MKTNRLIAAIMAAFALGVVNTKGVETQALPASLPIGSVEAFRSWIVTNQMVSVNNILYFTNTSGVLEGGGTFGGKNFNSYLAYQQFTGSNSLSLFNQLRSSMDSSKMLRFAVTVKYYIPELGGLVQTLLIHTNIGIVSTITSNSFVTAPVENELSYVHVAGLQQFTVEVSGLYTNSWPAIVGRPQQSPPAGFTPPIFPPELTTNNYVVLNQWYSMGTNDVTFSITTDGKTRRYNRFGEAFDRPPVMSIHGNVISASFTRGATITFESSPNLINWNPVATFIDSGAFGNCSIQYNSTQPKLFFRAGSH